MNAEACLECATLDLKVESRMYSYILTLKKIYLGIMVIADFQDL